MGHDADAALPLEAAGEEPLGRVAGGPLVLREGPAHPLPVPLDRHGLRYCFTDIIYDRKVGLFTSANGLRGQTACTTAG